MLASNFYYAVVALTGIYGPGTFAAKLEGEELIIFDPFAEEGGNGAEFDEDLFVAAHQVVVDVVAEKQAEADTLYVTLFAQLESTLGTTLATKLYPPGSEKPEVMFVVTKDSVGLASYLQDQINVLLPQVPD